MDFNETITFQGGLNTDDTPQGMPKGDYRDFSYCRLGYNSGNAFAVETSNGTIEINNSNITVDDKVLGATQWIKENAIVYFLYKDTGVHEIWYYDINTQTNNVLIQDSVLNFDINFPIYHANIVEDILKWTDGRWDPAFYEPDGTRLFNPPYQINLRKVIENFYTSIDLQVIDAIKWPLNPPRVFYITDTSRVDNKLQRSLYRFMIQPVYENGEVGVWSMFSNLPLPLDSGFMGDGAEAISTDSNGISITFETGPQVIRKINVAVQKYSPELLGTIPPWGVFLELDKTLDLIPDNSLYTYIYYGDTAVKPLIEPLKNYDRLPIVSNCQEYLPTNQIVYTNFREGYDKVDIVSPPPGSLISTNASFELKEILNKPYYGTGFFSQWPTSPGGIFIMSMYVGVWADFSDLFFFSSDMEYKLYTPNFTTYFSYKLSEQEILNALTQVGYENQNLYIFNILATYFSQQTGGGGTYTLVDVGGDYYEARWNTYITDSIVRQGSISCNREVDAKPSLKVGAKHQFGIVYGDRAYRDGTVMTSEKMEFFIPWYSELEDILEDPPYNFIDEDNPFKAFANINIYHQPPIWADRYWIVAKPDSDIISFGQYMICGAGDDPVSISWTSDGMKLEIDNRYEIDYRQAQIQHQIKVGDKLRFLRRQPDNDPKASFEVAYFNNYIEVEILKYVPASGSAGTASGVNSSYPARDVIYTSYFDVNDIPKYGSENNRWGSIVEIYTPAPSVDDNGDLFVGVWRDITGAIPILNPHTDARVHGVEYGQYQAYSDGVNFYINGEVSWDVLGYGADAWSVQVYTNDVLTGETKWTILSTQYDQVNDRTILNLTGSTPTANQIYFITRDVAQEWDTVTNQLVLNATIRPSYGDVYVKQRIYGSGYDLDGNKYFYYYIEDPHYSDYWSSDIHQTGRFRIQDTDAKNKLLSATSIHSGSYIVDTNVNNLSSFSLDSSNIEEMNPVYGGVVRTYMSGREGKTLKCLQPKRENSIYIQYYPNEVGSDSSVRVSNRTFASWFDYKSLFGCSDAGATALLPNGAVMYFDNNSGVFIYSGGNGQIVVSEIDPDTGKDYKFRTKTKQLAKAYNESANPLVRTYINETVGEVGFAFSFDNEETYEHVVFDYVNMRWRSTYDYNFRQFCNLGQTLVGWGKNNQLYLHNQDGVWTFHGDSFIQKVSFVSNENPLLLKRYQDITLISDDKFSIEAVSEPNRSYPLGMKTMMRETLLGMFEGYGKTNYRKNLYDPKFWIDANISTTNLTTWTLNGNQTSLNGEMITIIQDSDKNIYTGIVDNPVYNSGTNTTDIEIVGLEPGTTGVTGRWYLSEKVLLNGEDIRANALTHTLSYDPAPGGIPREGSVLFSVGISGVLS